MITATKKFAVAAAGGRVASAMAADVVKAAQNAVVAASDQERFSNEIESEIVARAGDLVNMTDDLPGGGKKPVLFVVVGCRIDVERCGQRGSAGNIAINIAINGAGGIH